MEAIMPDRPLSERTREFRDPPSRISETTIIMGIVFLCVLLGLLLFGAGMFDTSENNSTKASTQAPVTTQMDSQAPAPGEDRTP